MHFLEWKYSPKFVPKGQIKNITALVQIMAWRRPGDKPLSEPMMVISLTHIYELRPGEKCGICGCDSWCSGIAGHYSITVTIYTSCECSEPTSIVIFVFAILSSIKCLRSLTNIATLDSKHHPGAYQWLRTSTNALLLRHFKQSGKRHTAQSRCDVTPHRAGDRMMKIFRIRVTTRSSFTWPVPFKVLRNAIP